MSEEKNTPKPSKKDLWKPLEGDEKTLAYNIAPGVMLIKAGHAIMQLQGRFKLVNDTRGDKDKPDYWRVEPV